MALGELIRLNIIIAAFAGRGSVGSKSTSAFSTLLSVKAETKNPHVNKMNFLLRLSKCTAFRHFTASPVLYPYKLHICPCCTVFPNHSAHKIHDDNLSEEKSVMPVVCK